MQKPLSIFLGWGGGGGGGLPTMPFPGGPRPKGYLFQASGICKDRDFTSWSIEKSREICHLGLWKGPKGGTDEFFVALLSRRENVLFL